MNRPTLFILVLIAMSQLVFCQEKITEKDAPFNKYKAAIVKLQPLKEKQPLFFPVHSIEVLDVRQDTTKLGYVFHNSNAKSFRKLHLDQDAATGITQFLNNSFMMGPSDQQQKVLYCIRKLWVGSLDTVHNMLRYVSPEKEGRLFLEAELFLEKDSICYPLYRFDSIFIYQQKPTEQSTSWIEQTLILSLSRLRENNPEKVIKRNFLRRSEINDYYAGKKHTAIAVATPPAKGVYLTVDQFKNNRPSFTDYQISLDKIADIMRVKDKDTSYTIITKDWGFCDGEKIFIRIGANYFPLFKMGDTYELLASTSVLPRQATSSSPYYVPGNGYSPGHWASTGGSPFSDFWQKNTKAIENLKPFQLDMETGKVY